MSDNVIAGLDTQFPVIDGVVGQVDAARFPRYGAPATFARLPRRDQVADADVHILGIPFDKYSQAGLFPIAYTKGTDFKKAKRLPAEQLTHWNSW